MSKVNRYDFDYICNSFIEAHDGCWVPAPDYDALKSTTDNLIAALDEYNDLLGKEINDLIPYSICHGWKSKRYDMGTALRERIAHLRGELDK